MTITDAERLIDLVHAARDEGIYEADPAWFEVDDLLRLLRPSKPLRGVSLPPDPGGPVGFTCPVCGAHADELRTSVDAHVIEVYPQIEAWPGGPVFEDHGAIPKIKVLDRTLTTDVCACAFKASEWDFAWRRHATSGRTWMTITPKPEFPQ